MKKPDFTPQQIEWISEEIIGDCEPVYVESSESSMGNDLTILERINREIRNELRREQERRLRE